MLIRPATDRAMKEHWRNQEHFDTLIVRDVPLGFPPLMAAIMSVRVAERHRCTRIRVDQGMRKREYSIQDVHAAMRRYRPGQNELGVAYPDQREASRPMWPVGTILGADGLPKGD